MHNQFHWSLNTGRFLTRLKARMLLEMSHAQGLTQLLMKPRNGMPWSAEDKAALRAHLRRIAKALPAFGIFSLPGGTVLLPLLAALLDRRKRHRGAEVAEADDGAAGRP